MEFKKAERKKVKLKIAIQAPSGGGKTYSALLMAKALAGPDGKIALIDTENGSGSLYSDVEGMPAYDTLEIHAPYHTDKYVKAIKAAEAAGYAVVIVDSTSHQWVGEGGILDRMDKEKMANKSLNHFTLWAKYTPEHERFKAAIVNSQIHLIATLRSKTEYAINENDKGKMQPKKLGMQAQQRDQFEYEFTTVFDVNMDHHFTVSKDRTGLFDQRHEILSEEHGKELMKWLESGKEPTPVPDKKPEAPKKTFEETLAEFGWSKEQAQTWCLKKFKIPEGTKATPIQINELLAIVKTTPPDQALFALMDEPPPGVLG